MKVRTECLVAMTDANQNFSKVTRMVEESGVAVILKNNKPRYVVLGFDEYESMMSAMEMRKETVDRTADRVIEGNMEALLELAK